MCHVMVLSLMLSNWKLDASLLSESIRLDFLSFKNLEEVLILIVDNFIDMRLLFNFIRG